MQRFLLFLAGLVFTPASLMAQFGQPTPERPPLFPARLGLETKWENFQKQALTPAALAAMLKEDPHGSQVVRWGDARYTSIWAAVQRRVVQESKLIAELRQSEERGAQTLIEQAGGDIDKLMPIARRYPWAASVHQALFDAGMTELRRGNHGFAVRLFQDVLLRSADQDLRSRAQVGVWLATAHEPYPGALDRAFEGIDPKAVYPLLGEKISASEIRKRLSAKKAAAPLALKALENKTLEVPGATSWIFERPTAHRDGVTVAGPSIIAWFDDSQAKPKWTQTSSLGTAKDPLTRNSNLSPGPFVPAVDSARLYTRWGMQPLGPKFGNSSLPSGIAAFDVHNGVSLWSTADNADWQDLAPINDPAAADGRLFVLAVSRTQDYSPVYLVCLEARDGAMLWKRELVQNNLHLASLQRVDVSRYGNAVTVSGGYVYCSTNVGVVACCDARDGLIEWLRTYPQDRAAGTTRKLGASPVAAGSRVIFLPRDAGLVFALDSKTGELAWLKGDDASTTLGIFEQGLILAGPRQLAAVHVDTGKPIWDKPFQESIDNRAILAGSAIYVGTRDKLFRLDSATGKIAEEKEWGKAESAVGLAMRGATLFGAKLGAEAVVVAPPAVVVAEKSARVVYRHPLPLTLDGRTDEWDHFQTTKLGAGGIKGRVLYTHDDETLYVGIAASGGDFRGSTLEIAPPIVRSPFGAKNATRWVIVADGASAKWTGPNVPEGAKAVVHHNLIDRTVTYELAIPLKSLAPRSSKDAGWGRQSLEFTLLPEGGRGPAFVKLVEDLYMHRLTAEQEAAGLRLATALPDVDGAWFFLEEYARARNPSIVSSADFLRDFIKSQPKSPATPHALLRLDQTLRKKVTDDPSQELLKLAEEVGVPEPVRAWYKEVAGSYLSQWLFVDEEFSPQAIELEIFDGISRRRVVCGPIANQGFGGGFGGRQLPGAVRVETINGKMHMWIGDTEVDPKTRQPLYSGFRVGADPFGKRIMQLPPDNTWHELRIPLLWFGIHDRPIHGISFKQTGGSNIYWDRTAVGVNGKETTLLENDIADGMPLGVWQWVEKPVKLGKKTHTTPNPQYRDEEKRHSVTFKKGFREHILAAPTQTPDIEPMITKNLPSMAPDEHAAAILAYADRLWHADVDKRKKARLDILSNAKSGDVLSWLDHFVALEFKLGNAKAVETIEALIKESKLPEATAKEFRERNRADFVRNWQVIGPFPCVDEKTPRELESGVDLKAEYKTSAGKVRWKLHESPAQRVDLAPLLAGEKSATMYAACWVHSDSKQQAILRVISANRVQMWLNPKQAGETILDEPFFRSKAIGVNTVPAELQAGWNEILIRLDSQTGQAGFSLDLRERDGSGPLPSVKYQSHPTGP